ncbi:MAG: transcriptional regulator [Robiginitomaculum sp.]|nr:MAG: transcriptional regulator [Robiginitomaculum sp.]
MDSRQLIARNLKLIRLAKRLSQEALALKADVDRTYVSGLERCIHNPSVDILDKLAGVLSVKTIEFFAEENARPAPPPLPRGRRKKAQ